MMDPDSEPYYPPPTNPYAKTAEPTAPPASWGETTTTAASVAAGAGATGTTCSSSNSSDTEADTEKKKKEKDNKKKTITRKELRHRPKMIHCWASLVFVLVGLTIFACAFYLFGIGLYVLGGLTIATGFLQLSAGILAFIVAIRFHRKRVKLCLFLLSILLVALYFGAIAITVRGGVTSDKIVFAIFMVSLLMAAIIIADLVLLLMPSNAEKVEKEKPRLCCI